VSEALLKLRSDIEMFWAAQATVWEAAARLSEQVAEVANNSASDLPCEQCAAIPNSGEAAAPESACRPENIGIEKLLASLQRMHEAQTAFVDSSIPLVRFFVKSALQRMIPARK
jgi:hypothetical protein